MTLEVPYMVGRQEGDHRLYGFGIRSSLADDKS